MKVCENCKNSFVLLNYTDFCSRECADSFVLKKEQEKLSHKEPIKRTQPVVIGEQLSRDEQIRIAALNAIKMIHLPPTYCMKNVIECADILEQYIKTGKAE